MLGGLLKDKNIRPRHALPEQYERRWHDVMMTKFAFEAHSSVQLLGNKSRVTVPRRKK